MTQAQRVLAALRQTGSRGVTQNDFAPPPNGGSVIDGGSRISRVAARVRELREDGYVIVSAGRREGFETYVLVGHEPSVPPVVRPLNAGWTWAHFCRRCDFPGERPCGPVCPTCGGDAIATVSLDARPQQNARRAA